MIDRERIEDVLERNKDGFPVLSVTYDNDFFAATDLSVDDEERLSGKTVRLVEVK